MANKAGNPNWKKGISGNKLGRPVGSKNKTTEQIRTYLQEIFSENLDNLANDLSEMNSFQRWQILNSVSKKVLPDLNSNSNINENSGAMEITVKYVDGDNDSF